MAERIMKVTHLLCRNDTALNWRLVNPILKRGEWGLETDTSLMKFGDGVTTWNSLGYCGASALTTDELDELYANA